MSIKTVMVKPNESGKSKPNPEEQKAKHREYQRRYIAKKNAAPNAANEPSAQEAAVCFSTPQSIEIARLESENSELRRQLIFWIVQKERGNKQ